MPAAPVKKTDFPFSTRSITCRCSSQSPSEDQENRGLARRRKMPGERVGRERGAEKPPHGRIKRGAPPTVGRNKSDLAFVIYIGQQDTDLRRQRIPTCHTTNAWRAFTSRVSMSMQTFKKESRLQRTEWCTNHTAPVQSRYVRRRRKHFDPTSCRVVRQPPPKGRTAMNTRQHRRQSRSHAHRGRAPASQSNIQASAPTTFNTHRHHPYKLPQSTEYDVSIHQCTAAKKSSTLTGSTTPTTKTTHLNILLHQQRQHAATAATIATTNTYMAKPATNAANTENTTDMSATTVLSTLTEDLTQPLPHLRRCRFSSRAPASRPASFRPACRPDHLQVIVISRQIYRPSAAAAAAADDRCPSRRRLDGRWPALLAVGSAAAAVGGGRS